MDLHYFPLQRAEMNLSGLLSQNRLQNDIKATKTVAMAITAFLFCYVPVIVYAVVGQHDGTSQADSWFSFLSWFTLLFSTVVNPIIYYLRSSRFRAAFKQFIKDPFASSDFKENSRWSGKGSELKEKQNGNITTKRDVEERSQMRNNFRREKRDEIKNSSVELLQTNFCKNEVGNSKRKRGEVLGSISTGLSCPVKANSSPQPKLVMEQKGACASRNQSPGSCKGKGKATEEDNDILRKHRSRNGSRKRMRHNQRKIHPMAKSGCPADDKQEVCVKEETKRRGILERRRNSIEAVCRRKQAWCSIEETKEGETIEEAKMAQIK